MLLVIYRPFNWILVAYVIYYVYRFIYGDSAAQGPEITLEEASDDSNPRYGRIVNSFCVLGKEYEPKCFLFFIINYRLKFGLNFPLCYFGI